MKRFVIALVSFLLLASFAANAQVDTTATGAQVDTVAVSTVPAEMADIEAALASSLSDPVLLPSFQNSLYISYGGLGLVEFAYMTGAAFAAALIAIASEDALGLRMSGNVQLGYARSINKWLWVGGDLGYEHFGFRRSEGDGVKESGLNTVTLMASAKADWFRRNKVAMYSKLSAGILGAFSQEDNSISPAFHVTLYGIETGSPQIRGFFEIGAGLSATLAAGLRYRF